MQFGLNFDYYSAAINNTKVDNFLDLGALVGIGISIPINKNSISIELKPAIDQL